MDDLLRHGVFVDLYRVVRQGVRAGVESYSIKKLESLYGFAREAELHNAGAARAEMDIWLELGAKEPLPADVREKVRVYNLDDCLSAWKLRDWLEALGSAALLVLGSDRMLQRHRGSRLQRVRQVENDDSQTTSRRRDLRAGGSAGHEGPPSLPPQQPGG